MIALNTLLLSQILAPQAFMGGSGFDLATQYASLSNRSVVCSEKIFNAYGPMRYLMLDNGRLTTDGTLFTFKHNAVRRPIELDPRLPSKPDIHGEVDSIVSISYPPVLVGLASQNLKKEAMDALTNQSTLTFSTIPKMKSIVGNGSDSIKSLSNRGLSKAISYPALFGELWYASSVAFCSEFDFVSSIAQLADCTVVEKEGSYQFEPDIEKIRRRLLKTYQLFGVYDKSIEAVKQRIRYRFFEIAPAEVIRRTISETKMFQELPVPNDKQLIDDIVVLKKMALDEYTKSGKKEVREFKEDGSTVIAYGYGFTAGIVVDMKMGRWMIW